MPQPPTAQPRLDGAQYLYRLVQRPNETIKASAIRGAVQASDNGTADQFQVRESLRQINGRLGEIAGELQAAKDDNDVATQTLLEVEKGKLIQEIARLTGKSGGARLSSPARKDAEAVRRAVRHVINGCKEKWGLPKLARHLTDAVQLGASVVYSPESPAPDWIF